MARQLERFDNLVSLFLTRAEEKGDAPFLWAKRDGQVALDQLGEAARQVAALAASLKAASGWSPATASRWSARTGPNG